MIIGCPVIEKLCFRHCYGLNKLMFANLLKIKKADVSGLQEVEIVKCTKSSILQILYSLTHRMENLTVSQVFPTHKGPKPISVVTVTSIENYYISIFSPSQILGQLKHEKTEKCHSI